jgi:CRP-like cAMP-binding protein
VPRSATVVAATPMRLVAFDVKNFRRLLDESPSARARLEALMDERAALLRQRRGPTGGEEDT